jgi:ATP-binding cassette subfamily B protein
VAVAWSFFFMLIATGMNLVQPKLVQWAVDFGIRPGEARTVVVAALALLGAAILSGGLHFASGILLVRAGQGMGFEIRNHLFSKILSFSFGNLDKWRTGELLVRTNADVNTIRMFVRMGLLMMVQSIIMLGGSLVLMYLTNAQLSVVMFIILPGTLALFFVLATLIRPLIMKVRARLDALNNALQENLAGAKVVRAFARQEYEKQRFEERNQAFLKLSLRVGYTIAVAFPFMFFLGQLAVVLASWFGGVAVIENILNPQAGGLTLGELLAFNEYALMAMWPILALGMTLQFLSMASASATRIEELLADQPRIAEKSNPKKVNTLRGEISFNDVCFAYGEGENAVDHVDIDIKAGEKIGILGRTGSGKSSLASLVPRFYDVDSGSVTIDGIDVRDFEVGALRERVALVLQETVLVSGTILENLTYAYRTPGGRTLNEPDDTVIKATEMASAKDFILEKENQWQEHVGERGSGLSGGQRQRVAIARAILADPDILILDDVTSALDARTEKEIVRNLYAALADKTVLIISQKVNTIMLCDRILLMDEGKIVATGSHDELRSVSDTYREIYETQSSELRT